MAAHQAPLSLGFPRQEHWSGLPFPSPMHESEKWKWSWSVVSDSSRPHGLQPTRLLRPWDSPGKSTGVGCHCLLCGARLLGFKSELCHLQNVRHWSGYRLSVSIRKVWVIAELSQRVMWGVNELLNVMCLVQSLEHSKCPINTSYS